MYDCQCDMPLFAYCDWLGDHGFEVTEAELETQLSLVCDGRSIFNEHAGVFGLGYGKQGNSDGFCSGRFGDGIVDNTGCGSIFNYGCRSARGNGFRHRNGTEVNDVQLQL